MRADEFYPIFGHFWPFWLILCTLAHFGENTVILGAPSRRKQMGNRGYPDPNRPRRHPSECIFVSPKLPAVKIWTHMRVSEPSWCHGNCNYPFVGAHQNDCVFTKMHQRAQNEPKWPKMAKNRVKFVCTHFLDPPRKILKKCDFLARDLKNAARKPHFLAKNRTGKVRKVRAVDFRGGVST